MLSDQPYRYLTVDEMKSLGDDSLPIDVTRDERVDSNRMAQSAEYGAGLQQPIVEDAISPQKAQSYNTAASKSTVDGIYMANGLNEDQHRHIRRKLQWKSFLVSFLVDARGGAMRGCRHSGVRMIIPSRSTCQPTRVTCRYVKPQRSMHPPQLMEGEALASRVLELGPVSTKFIGPVIMEVPHFASLRGKEREIIILRSDNGETWREHTIDNSEEIIHDVLQQCFEPEEIAQLEEQAGNHVCRFVTYDFPQYFAVVTRIRQEVHAIGPEGGMVSSTVVPQVQAVFPQGALTKKIKVGLQAQPVDPDLTAKLLGRGVAVSPIVTVEPRRRKFHKAITLSMPAPKAHSQGMINQYSGNTPTLRLLCSITGGPSRAQWEDVTGSTPLTFVNDCVSFTTTVSARFWLMDCRNISEATKMATELYKEVIHVPFIAKFVVFAKKIEPFEARLRVFCMTDDREDKTLEKMELYTQVAKSRDVEVLEGKPQFIEMAGNLVPVTKSGEQLQLPFKAFRENRLPFTVRVKDQHADIVGRTLFMKEPKVAKGEPPQHPICILNIVLPEAVIPDSVTAFSDKITPTYRSSVLSYSKHQNDHYIGDIRIVDLSNLLGKDWIQLASEIDISTEEIDEIINQNTDSIARQAQSMIRLYKDKPNYDIHSLEYALKSIGRDDIMSKCKSGRLSHSRDFEETDIMKNSESVEELVRQESKRIQQIHEREEVKYSAEEKDIEESESDEEIAKRTVAERREKIVKRLSVERQIPASSQKKEITREITEIKRKSLIEDKKAIHESEIFMQLPADNSVKSAVVPEQVIKMKMGKIDSTEVSKSDFDKELTHKFKSSSRSSEEEPEEESDRLVFQTSHREIDNFKIVKDITSVEKTSKIIDSLKGEKPSMKSGSKQLTEDFLTFEKLTQLPSQDLSNTSDVTEKFVQEVKEKSKSSQISDKIKKTAEEVASETVEIASKKVDTIISSFDSPQQEKHSLGKEPFEDVQDFLASEKITFVASVETFSKEESPKVEQPVGRTNEPITSKNVSVKNKIKAFTEPKFGDFTKKVASKEESIKSSEEFKLNKVKSEKTKLQNEILSKTKSTFDNSETYTESEIKDFKSEETKNEQNVFHTKDSVSKISGPTEAKSTKFSETMSNILTTNESEFEDGKKVFSKVDSQAAIIKEHAKDTKGLLVSETKKVAETIKPFTEGKTKDHKTEVKIMTRDYDIKPEDSITTKISTEPKIENLTKELSRVETKVSEVNETFVVKRNEDLKSELKEMKDKLKDSHGFIITETKTVSETIKSFSEPKVTTSKIEQKFNDPIDFSKKDSIKVAETIKSFSDSFDKPSSTASQFDKDKTITSAKIEDKIADFETKKVVYEFYDPETNLKLGQPTKTAEVDEKANIDSAPAATPGKFNTSETIKETTFEESREKLKEMKSIVTEAQKITKDFLNMEQQSQLPVQIKGKTKLIEETIKTTITFPPIVEAVAVDKKTQKEIESKPNVRAVSSKTQERETGEKSEQETVLDSRKLTHVFLSMEQKSQLPYEKQTADDFSELSTETSQHSVEKSPVMDTESEKISLEQFEKVDIDQRKITHDFLSMEQKLQPFPAPKSQPQKSVEQAVPPSIISEVLIKASDIMTTISAGAEIPKKTIASQKEKIFQQSDSSAVQSELLKEDGIEIAAPIKEMHEMPVSTVKTLTQDFLTFEQSTPIYATSKSSTDNTKTTVQCPDNTFVTLTSELTDLTHKNVIEMTGAFLSMEQTTQKPKLVDELKASIPVEPRKSLTDAEFCKSVQEVITKKMSEGLIEISDELKTKEGNIPYSQTPPPTPIETKTEKEQQQQQFTTDEDNLVDTVKTLHKTTESTFERVSTISTIETLQTYIPEPQEILSVKKTPTQETKSTDISRVPQSVIAITSSKISQDTADTNSKASVGDVPKPKPRHVRVSTPTEDSEKEEVENISLELPHEIEEQDIALDLLDDLKTSVVPVPKPRSQNKTSDCLKNLDFLTDQQQHLSQSEISYVSLRSFDYTEDTSHTDEPSVSVSIKSQHLDYPLTTTATTTTSEDPATESIDPTSELSVDDGSVETERKTSFYIGESSRNIITKTTPTKLSASEGTGDEPLTEMMNRDRIEATDISVMKEVLVDSDEESDVFKEYVTIKPSESEKGIRIRRQSSETRNDLLEEDAIIKDTNESTTLIYTMPVTPSIGVLNEDATLRKTSTEQSFSTTIGTSTTSISSAPLEVIHSTGEDDSIREISESMDIEIERRIDLDLSLEKSEWETAEKEIPPKGTSKIVHSPQLPILGNLTKETLTEEMVTKTLEEVQESLDAAKDELKTCLKDGKFIKESPSEFEFRSFSQTITNTEGGSIKNNILDTDTNTKDNIEETVDLMESEYISSFIGVPENLQNERNQDTEDVLIDSLNKEVVILHYSQNMFDNRKPETSLGFVSTGTADSNTSSEDNIVKEERASLGFISSETAEDFSSMEDYYQEKLANADVVIEAKEDEVRVIVAQGAADPDPDTFGEITSDLSMKPFEDVVHRIKINSSDSTQNRWSVPDIDQSSSSESYYKSFEKTESRPLSSDIENLVTQANSSEYQTAADVSSVYRETTEFVSAVSTFDSSSGKTISSHESMRSLDSQSENSANLGSIDVSELSETLVASSTEEREEIQHLRDLADENDSDDSLDLNAADYTGSGSKMKQQSQMKRSQEMIFKPKSDDLTRNPDKELESQEMCLQSAQIVENAKPKEVEKTVGITYPMEEIKTNDLKEDILLYHGDVRYSIDDNKYASSLDEGSILSVSISSTSNIDTIVENFGDIAGSFGTSSLAGIEGFAVSSLPEETTFVMDMDAEIGNVSPQDSSEIAPPGETHIKPGHKRTESTAISEEDIKIPDKDAPASVGEGKESESESDTDPYETEYARQFRSPTDRKNKKKKQAAAEMDYSFETEKRPFTPSQLVAEVIVEDSLTEELEAEDILQEERRPSQNMLNYANIPDITVTEDAQPKSPILKEDAFKEKPLYKVKTEEELHKATDDRPLHEKKETTMDIKEEVFQKRVQEQYKQKLAELQKAEIGEFDYDYNKAPDSPDSFEMVDQPDICDEFVIIEEVAKEANEDDLGGKSIRIAPTKYESKHDEEVEKIIIKSAPADPKLGSQIFRDDLNFEFEESPPTASSGEAEIQEVSDSGTDMVANNKRWVEMQLTDNQLRYPYDLTGGVLEDIKEEDGEFEVGSSRISSFKDSFSSTPEYDVMAARRYYATRGEHDDISMSSLQEFESLEQAISLENRNRTHQGSTDSSNGSFQRRYILRSSANGAAQGDDVSISSLKEFEGLENACIEAHLIEIKAKEEAALLSRSDESNKSNNSDRIPIIDPSKVVITKVSQTVTHTEVLPSVQQPPNIETLLKQKLQECGRAESSTYITPISKPKVDSDRGSIDSLEMNRSLDTVTSSIEDSFDISKEGTTKSDIDSLEVDKQQSTREESFELNEVEQLDDVMAKFGVSLSDATTTTTTTSTDTDGREHTTVTTRVLTKSKRVDSGASSTSLDALPPEIMTKEYSAESLNQMSILDQTTTSSAGTTATYQTSAGNSQMSGSITSCASSTLMEDSITSTSGLTKSPSYWSHEDDTVKEHLQN